MFEVDIAILLVVCLIGLVAIGVHIAIALGMTSALGIFLATGATEQSFYTVQAMLAAKAYEGIRDCTRKGAGRKGGGWEEAKAAAGGQISGGGGGAAAKLVTAAGGV